MTKSFRIRRPALTDIVAHARDDAPNECCGLLVGAGDVIDRAIRARNLHASPTRFLLDPKDHIDALRAQRGSSSSVVGVYHSHPHSAPTPSETDVREASYPEYLYLIVGWSPERPNAETRGYRFEGGVFVEVEVVPVA